MTNEKENLKAVREAQMEMGKFENALEKAEETSDGTDLLHSAVDVQNVKHISKIEVAKCVFGMIMTFVTIYGNIAIISHYGKASRAVEPLQNSIKGLAESLKTIPNMKDYAEKFENFQQVEYIVYFYFAIVWLFARGTVHAVTFVVLVRRNETIASLFVGCTGTVRYLCMIVACVLLMGPVVLNVYIIYLLFKQRDDKEINEWRMLLVNFKLGDIVAGTAPQLAMNVANMSAVTNSVLAPILEMHDAAESDFREALDTSLELVYKIIDQLVGTTEQKFQLAQGIITSTLGLTTWTFNITKSKFKREGHHPASGFIGLFVLIGCAITASTTIAVFNPARHTEMFIPLGLNIMNLILIVAFIAAPWKRWIWRVVATLVHTGVVAGVIVSMILINLPIGLDKNNLIEKKLGDIMFANLICTFGQGLFGLLILPTSLICVKVCNPLFCCCMPKKEAPKKDEEEPLTMKNEESEA